jgi:hypothetical protein
MPLTVARSRMFGSGVHHVVYAVGTPGREVDGARDA